MEGGDNYNPGYLEQSTAFYVRNFPELANNWK